MTHVPGGERKIEPTADARDQGILAFPVALSGAFWEYSTAEGLGDIYYELRRCAVQNFRRDFGPDSSFGFRLFVDGERVPRIRDWVFLTPGEIIVPTEWLRRARATKEASATRGSCTSEGTEPEIWLLNPVFQSRWFDGDKTQDHGVSRR